MMSEFIRAALSSARTIRLRDPGAAVKTYGYVADVVSMILFVALRGKETIYDVGGCDAFSIRQLAGRIGKATGARVIIPRGKSAKTSYHKLDLSKILKEMKRFKFTPFVRGLANTIDWSRAIR